MSACKHFDEELRALVRRFRMEYELTYAEAVGCLMLLAVHLAHDGDPEDEE